MRDTDLAGTVNAKYPKPSKATSDLEAPMTEAGSTEASRAVGAAIRIIRARGCGRGTRPGEVVPMGWQSEV